MTAQPASSATTDMPAPVAAPVERVNLQPILEFQPFGTAAKPAVAEPIPVEAPSSAPAPVDQPRGLALHGVLLPDSGASQALLSMDGGPTQSYDKGDTLPGGGTLFEIAADHIWIDINGQRKTLGFVDQPAQGTANARVEDPATESAEPVIEPVPEPAAKPARKAKSVPQPDLRHLIPGLSQTSAKKP
jgi:type II secretory pathway component PulC